MPEAHRRTNSSPTRLRWPIGPVHMPVGFVGACRTRCCYPLILPCTVAPFSSAPELWRPPKSSPATSPATPSSTITTKSCGSFPGARRCSPPPVCGRNVQMHFLRRARPRRRLNAGELTGFEPPGSLTSGPDPPNLLIKLNQPLLTPLSLTCGSHTSDLTWTAALTR